MHNKYRLCMIVNLLVTAVKSIDDYLEIQMIKNDSMQFEYIDELAEQVEINLKKLRQELDNETL